MNYNQAIEYLYNRLPVFHRIGEAAYKPGLENSIKLMASLKNPQNKYKTIHVAGTNGKGSVSHCLSAILQSAGYNVGLYTSPHLVDFRERIRINGKMISEKYVIDFVENHTSLLEDIKPSFFETTMAMAFDYFAYCNVDVAVIEVGMGGRLDSTNIITPVISVITNISYDHTQFLGDTLEKIASEKAGIIKHKIPVVIGETNPETKKVFLNKAKKEQTEISFADDKFNFKCVDYEDNVQIFELNKYNELRVGLRGEYQQKNIATVLTTINKLQEIDFNIAEKNIRQGLEYVIELTGFQGRWQVLQDKPKVIADTAHNKAGIQHVVSQLKNMRYDKLHVVLGMVNDKDISSMLSVFPQNGLYYFTNANIIRALNSETLREKAQYYSLHGKSYKSVQTAVSEALQQAGKNDLIFIGGSNFIVGEAIPLFTKNTP